MSERVCVGGGGGGSTSNFDQNKFCRGEGGNGHDYIMQALYAYIFKLYDNILDKDALRGQCPMISKYFRWHTVDTEVEKLGPTSVVMVALGMLCLKRRKWQNQWVPYFTLFCI